VLTTNQVGAIAEAEIVSAALKLGIGVFSAVHDERYDLIFDLHPRLLRVQCKTAIVNGDVVVIRCYSTRRSAEGLVKRVYTRAEIDAIAAYCREIDRVFLVSVNRIDGRSHIQLRLRPPRNNQTIGVNWADDFDFAATLGRLRGP
jgi:PD-(D/E)XK endonuclease